MRTCIKARMNLNFGQIPPLTKELAALEHLKNRCHFFYAPSFEKVGDILVSACPCVGGGGGGGASRYRLETSCLDSSWKNSRHVFLAHLSQRLRGELIVYPSSRRPSVRASVCSHFQTGISLRPMGR